MFLPLATETIPTTLTSLLSNFPVWQSAVESYASWGLWIAGAIAAATVLIGWFAAAQSGDEGEADMGAYEGSASDSDYWSARDSGDSEGDLYERGEENRMGYGDYDD